MTTRASRLRRWAIVLAALFVVYLIAGFLVAPAVIRSHIEEHGTEALGRAVTVEKVRLNPLVFSLAIEGLRVADRDGGELASWRLAYVNFDPLTSLFRQEWHLGEVRLVAPKQRLAIAEDGTLNIADLLALAAAGEETPPEDEAAEDALPAFGIDRLSIEGWELAFSDRSLRAPFSTVVGPTSLALTGLTTRPNERSPCRLAGTTNTGETFGWNGTVTLQPLGSRGRIEFTNFSIPKHAPFAADLLEARIKAGRVSVASDYEVALADGLVVRLENARLAVDELALAAPAADQPSAGWTRLAVDMPAADLVARTAEIARIELTGLSVTAERRPDGSIDLLDWIPAPAGGPPAATGEAGSADSGPAPSVRIAEIVVSDARVHVVDRTNPRPADVVIDQLALAAKNAGTDLDREVDVDLKFRINETGTFGAAGTVRPRPFAAALDLQADGVALAPFDPFVEPFAAVRIGGGTLGFAGRVETSLPPGGTLALHWSGDAAVNGLDVTESGSGAHLLAWQALAFRQATFGLEPLEFSAVEIALDQPSVDLLVAEDGTVNVAAALRLAGASSEAGTESAVAGAASPGPAGEPQPPEKTSEIVAAAGKQKLPFEAEIGAITISGGRVHVADRSVGSGFSTELRDFGGSIRGLSSESLARAEVDLGAKLGGVAPLKISGRINPLAEDKYSDLKVDFSNIDLPLFTPYAGRYLGQKIQKGKLNIDLAYKVSQSVLEGENHVLLDQFYLGEKVDSPDALKLPIGLALALLRDREGKIDLDVPVRGNLDDPDFRYGSVVWKAFGNIILKAATSPFSMLGGILGGIAGGASADLSYVDFASGSAAIQPDAEKKLGLLARALFERPALQLEIKAPPAPESDRPGLLQARFEAMIEGEMAKGPAPAAATAPAPAPASATNREEAVRAIFARLFPEEAAAALPPPATATATAAVAGESSRKTESGDEKRPGLLTRIWRTVTGSAEQERAEPEPKASAAAEPTEPPPPRITVAEMRQRILGRIELGPADFTQLAGERARAIQARLLEDDRIAADRIFLVDATTIPEGANPAPQGTRVFFGLQ